MVYRSTILFLILLTSSAYAEVCTQKLLISNAWLHVKSGDLYVLEADGDMKCKNEKRHREECDYVYTSDFIGIPKGWELTNMNKLIITFDTGVFKSEKVEYDCLFNQSKNSLYAGEVIFVRTSKPDD